MSVDQPMGPIGPRGAPNPYGPGPGTAPAPVTAWAPTGYGPAPVDPGVPIAAPRRRAGIVVVSVLAALALVAAGVAVFLVLRPEPSEAGEVFLEAADLPGPDPFTTQVKVDPLPTTTSTTSTAPTTVAPVAGGTQVAATIGSQPGLYGGTQNNGRCDPNQLVTFLEANPDKARAWVDALNADPSLRWSGGTQVQVNQIRAYVRELTPLTLTVDTRVTNHGFVNGRPTPRQAVLQRGTAVLVDAYGVPRAKCGCGNPLARPVAVRTTPRYQGPPWLGWNPTNVVVVQQTTVVVTTFVIVNLAGPGYLDRPAGSTGDRDAPSAYTGPGTTPSTTPSTTASTTASTTGPSVTTAPPTSTPTTLPTTAPPTAPTTASTTASTAPTTASTAPPATLAPPDFCAQFQATQAKWGNVDADTPAQRAELMADFDRLAAAAPAEVRDDMTAIADWLRPALSSGNLDLGNIPANIQAALVTVEAYLKNVCGISTG